MRLIARDIGQIPSIAPDCAQLRPITPDWGYLSSDELQLMKYLFTNRKISRREAIGLLQLGETKIKSLFNDLLAKGLIKRKGQGRSTYYEIVKGKQGIAERAAEDSHSS